MYQAPRGTADRLPEDQKYWRYVEDRAADVCRRFGFNRIDTPVFEPAGLFLRGVGGGTDVVTKETYTFEDRGGDALTLRPEGTAPVCRAYLEHGMSNLPQPVRLYYLSPIFRYERPQAGRYRQHHQFGIEAIGEADPAIDADVIQAGWMFTQELGLKGLSLIVNSIGDSVCHPAYLQNLKDYYKDHLDKVCKDCLVRFERNPLRLLDCKQDSCQTYIKEAPASADHLCQECQKHWDTLQGYLRRLDIDFTVEHRLVRGLDYYTRTVFEIQPPEEGSQSTVLGGGRYDGLIEELGGRPTPGIGFGSGIERLIVNMKRQGVEVPEGTWRPVVVVCLGNEAQAKGVEVAAQLRNAGMYVLLAAGSRSMRGQMRYASSMQARFAVVIGEEELARKATSIRDMDSGNQEEVPWADVTAYLLREPAR